jgi:hypothetical protein
MEEVPKVTREALGLMTEDIKDNIEKYKTDCKLTEFKEFAEDYKKRVADMQSFFEKQGDNQKS